MGWGGCGGRGGNEVWRCQLASQSQKMALGYEKKIIIRSHLSITRHPLVMWKRKERVKRGREGNERGRYREGHMKKVEWSCYSTCFIYDH